MLGRGLNFVALVTLRSVEGPADDMVDKMRKLTSRGEQSVVESSTTATTTIFPMRDLLILYQLLLFPILTWTTWSLWKLMKSRKSPSSRSVAVLVLGDIGRSPRMMYHAQSFAEHDFVTDVIGYGGISVK